MDDADVTRLLNAAMGGNDAALERVLPGVYESLRRLARGQMAREAADHTLEPTALVHEAYLRIVGGGPGTWENRRHFFGTAAEAMRRILIEHARRGKTLKHGSGRERRGLDSCEAVAAMGAPAEDLLALDEALTKLMREDAVKGELVKLSYFGGLGLEEAAGVLGLSRTMAYRHWQYARAWLHDAITRGGK